MAPPGFAPPSYANEQIPTRYLHKEPPPAGIDTNGRAYLIFFSYLGLSFVLTNYIILKLVKGYGQLQRSTAARPSKKHIRIFVGLAAGSILIPSYYQYRAFNVSYRTWLMWRSFYDLNPEQRHWGLWLKETKLFRETWETTIVGNANYWWTHQIFFFAGVLALSLEQRGIRRGIKHTWAFMILGQSAGISFATNLFLLTLLLSPPPPPPPSSTGIYRRKYLGPWIINLLTIVFTQVPAYMLADEHYWYHQTDFMPMLLTPHIALLVLPITRAILPNKFFTDSNVEFAGTVYKYLWTTTFFGGGLLFLRVTSLAWNYSGIRGIRNALLEHPAVGSVGFDVIFCWVSWIVWYRIERQSASNVLDTEDEDDDESEWVGTGSGHTVSVVNEDSGVRRR